VQRCEVGLAGEDPLTELAVPAGVPVGHGRRSSPALEQGGGHQQRLGEGVDAADVAVEQVDPVDALAPQLRVEVEAAGGEAPAPQDLVQRQAQLLDAVGELVGVPAVLRIAPVRVDAAEQPVSDAVRHLVVEGEARQRGVVHLEVEVDLPREVVADEEGVHGGGVPVVLVLGRLEGFGSMKIAPGKPIRCLCSTTRWKNRASCSSSRRRSC
jgi:hypothetical protein